MEKNERLKAEIECLASIQAYEAHCRFERQAKAVVDLCQSPIEALFAVNLLYAMDVCHPAPSQEVFAHWMTGPYKAGEDLNLPFDGIFIFQQAQIGKYRADFLAVCYFDGKTTEIVIECDGHDYHERTKEQAAHDRSRDRAMVSNDITVLRYTGSEIHKNPTACATQACGIIQTKANNLLAGKV